LRSPGLDAETTADVEGFLTDSQPEDAQRVGAEIGIDCGSAPFDVEQFRRG
jgi:hypothetical protein